MNYRTAALSAAGLWVASGTAVCDEEAAPVAPAAETSSLAPVADKLVCHYEKPTGSHVREKVCRTQAQIKAAEESSQRVMDEARARGNQLNASGG